MNFAPEVYAVLRERPVRDALRAEVARRARERLTTPGVPEWTRGRITAAIELFVERHGRTPRKVDFCSAEGLPSRKTLGRHFDSLAAAFEAAGVVGSIETAEVQGRLFDDFVEVVSV